MDAKIREFEVAVLNLTNQSDLPIEVKRLVFCEVLQKVSETSDSVIKHQISKRKEVAKSE